MTTFRTTGLLGTLALTALSTGVAQAAFSFRGPVNYPIAQRPGGVAAGDFDNDGDLDLAVTADNPDRVVILLNDGAGSFTFGPVVNLDAGVGAGSLVAARLDGDNTVHLAVALQNTGQVVFLRNAGGANFSIAGTFNVGSNPRSLSAGDVEPDGDVDLVVANRDSNSVSFLINGGNGNFAVTTVAAGAEPRGATFGDFDGDGDLDAAASNHDDRSITVYRNNGGGSFSFWQTLSVGGNVRPEGITSADLNNDGRADIAAAANGNGLEVATVFLSTGNGFTGPSFYPTGGLDTSEIASSDLDCDGLIDLVTGNNDSGNISVLPNTGHGAFGAAMNVATGATPEAVIAAQLDGRGGPDLAVANRDSNTLSVLLNDSCARKDGDVDGDGDVDLADLAALLAAFNCCSGDDCYNADADLNGSGCVDLPDLATLLANFGT